MNNNTGNRYQITLFITWELGWVITCHSTCILRGVITYLCPSRQSPHILLCCICEGLKNSSGQNGRHFADDIFKCIFINEKSGMLVRITSKFVHKGPVGIKSTLVQIMTWCRTGDKPLPEPMLPRSLRHIRSTWGDPLRPWGVGTILISHKL